MHAPPLGALSGGTYPCLSSRTAGKLHHGHQRPSGSAASHARKDLRRENVCCVQVNRWGGKYYSIFWGHSLLAGITKYNTAERWINSMSIVFPVDAQAIARFAVSMTNRALVEPAKVVHLKMLLHVAHVYSHFAAQKALNALSASSVLLCVCRDKFVEFKLLLVAPRLHACSRMRIVGCAEKTSEF